MKISSTSTLALLQLDSVITHFNEYMCHHTFPMSDNNCSFLSFFFFILIQILTFSVISHPLPQTLRETYCSLTPLDEVTMEEVGQTTQLRAGELIIIVVVLIMWAGENKNVSQTHTLHHSTNLTQ